jgi:hypothetical protein
VKDFESEGREFESLRARQLYHWVTSCFLDSVCCSFSGLTLSFSRFDSFCFPFVQFHVELSDDAPHLRLQVGELGVVQRHLWVDLSQSICDGAFVVPHLSQDHRDGMS